MKTIIKHGLAMIAIVIAFISFSANKAIAQAGPSVTYQTFYDDLSPYGTWIDYPAYGHVWHPAITGDFRPYLTNGFWDYSTEGWTWQSNYSWGWAPFHYGRWIYDDMYGWLWIPGYEWSPAWVTWGMADNFYGWAPLMPEVNVGIAFGSWRPAAFYWNFVGKDHIYDRDIFKHVEKRDIATRYINHIDVINNFSRTHVNNQFYSKGPDIKEVERYTKRSITPATLSEVNNRNEAKHEGNKISVFRPSVNTPQPKQFRRIDNNNTSPIRNNEDKINNGENKQRRNIDRLPLQKAPQFSFGHNENRGGRSRRN